MLEITAKDVVRLIREDIETHGRDFIYKAQQRRDSEGLHTVSCYYAENGCPSCLVGRVLHRAGVDIDVLEHWDTSAYGTSEGISEVELPADLIIDGEALHILSIAQDRQDVGHTLGAVADSIKEDTGWNVYER